MKKDKRSSHICSSVQLWNGLYTIEVRLTGENIAPRRENLRFRLLLDTGARFIGINRATATLLGLRRQGSEQIIGIDGRIHDVPATWAGIVVDERVAVPDLRIVQIEASDSQGNFAGLLGMEFLNKVQLYTDFSRLVAIEDTTVPLIRFYYPPENALEP